MDYERVVETLENCMQQLDNIFKGSDKIETSLGYLLDFVQSPYFTAETVRKDDAKEMYRYL